MKNIILLACFSLLLASMASAEIIVSQTSSSYNLGDMLNINVTVFSSSNSNGFLDINLICNNEETNIYRAPLTISTGGKKIIENSLLLTSSLEVLGNCKLKSNYNNEQTESQDFVISDRLDVFLLQAEINVEPGNSFKIKGAVFKDDGRKAEGYIEIIENSGLRAKTSLIDGKFEIDFSFPMNYKSGKYILNARAYEKYQEEITNQGSSIILVFVKQIPKRVEVFLSKDNVNPGESLEYNAVVFDQAGDVIFDKAEVKIISKNKIIHQEIVDTNDWKEFKIEDNADAETLEIKVEAFNLNASNSFVINGVEKVDVQINGNEVIIKNTGNIDYDKTIEIGIGAYKEVKNIALKVGETMKLFLNAPDGEYEVNVNAGSSNYNSKSLLTGGAVGITESREKVGSYAFVWIFLILICGLFVMNLMRKGMKKTSFSVYKDKDKIENKQPSVIKLSEMPVSGEKNIKDAEHSIVLNGRKETASLVAVKLKNPNSETSQKIKQIIHEKKGASYLSNNYLIGIFSSQTTRSFANEFIAVKVADAVKKSIDEINNNSKIKIEFGISVTSGEIIAKKENKLKFSGVGGTIMNAKNLADESIGEILIGESIQRKLMSEVKTEKKGNAYILKEISNRNQHDNFIKGFLKRQNG